MAEPDDQTQKQLVLAAHLGRRTSIGLHADRISQLAKHSWDDAIGIVLDNAASQVADNQKPPRFEDREDAVHWWLSRLLADDNGLLDAMNWFWHTVLTTNVEKIENELLGPQIHLLRSHSLGNYRQLLQAFVVDGALLQYLDGSFSQAHNPNENLGRELMELFTVGHGAYNQDDVRVAARALAGWEVEDGQVSFNRASSFNAPAIFRGHQADWDTESIVDALCDDRLTAIHISSRMWNHFVATEQSEAERDELGTWWQDQGLDILPLIERILRSDEFKNASRNRPKSALEWWASTMTSAQSDPSNLWSLEYLGQMPYNPPNVGGWPNGDRWLSSGSMLTRTSVTFDLDDLEAMPDPSQSGGRSDESVNPDDDWTVNAILERCGLYDISPETLAAVQNAGSDHELDEQATLRLRWRIVLCSPEFNRQ